MARKVDWEALEAIHARPAPNVNAVACHSLEVQIEMAEERAGILEYDWGWPRAKAEAYAFRNIEWN